MHGPPHNWWQEQQTLSTPWFKLRWALDLRFNWLTSFLLLTAGAPGEFPVSSFPNKSGVRWFGQRRSKWLKCTSNLFHTFYSITICWQASERSTIVHSSALSTMAELERRLENNKALKYYCLPTTLSVEPKVPIQWPAPPLVKPSHWYCRKLDWNKAPGITT